MQESPITGNAQHQEGVEHIKQNTEDLTGQPPASNPGSDDRTGGIASGSGGVSCTAYIGSPVQGEQKSVVESTIDTVKSYLANLSLVGGGGPSGEQTSNAGQQQSSSSGGAVESAKAAVEAVTAGTAAAGIAGSATAASRSDSAPGQQNASTNVRYEAPTPDSAVLSTGILHEKVQLLTVT